MKSVKTKIGALVLICVLVVAFLVGNVSIQSSRGVVGDNSEQILELLCANGAQTINALLLRIEQSVVTLSQYATSHIGDLQKFKTDKGYVQQYSNALEDIAVNAANNTEGAMTVYIRYNPDFTEPTSGVFYTRESAGGALKKLTPTDFSMYDASDAAHVGWYYIPVQNGKATWLAPYVNENLGIKMISFVIPLVVDNTSVGVVGMDIDFEVIEEIVNGTRAYESGYSFLADGQGNAILHPDFEMGAPLSSGGNGLDGVASQLQKEGSGGQLFTYTYGGTEKEFAFASLKNGMRFAITAPTAEIYSEANRLVRQIALIVVGAVLLSLLISWAVIRGIVRPLGELNRAAGKIAQGELDVTLSCHSKDEVGVLADSFRQTVSRLRTYIRYIDEITAVLAQIAQGNLAIEFEQQYEGDFAKVKLALQGIAKSLSKDISHIKAAARQVSDGAGQVASGAQVLSRGAAEQTTAVEDLSGLMGTMLGHAKEDEKRANSAIELTQNAGVALEECSRHMQAMMEAMGTISGNAQAITEIVKAINEIAMQTNILALNAAIEAARAGEAGKGFSVVADEVKNLAVKSMDASAKIAELVSQAVRSVENGGQIAAETEKYMADTVGSAQQVVVIVQDIAASSTEQADATTQVQQGVEKISAVVQQNSATSQEEAAASEHLSAQAQLLKNLVTKFQVDEAACADDVANGEFDTAYKM